jgi:hypothetical protein
MSDGNGVDKDEEAAAPTSQTGAAAEQPGSQADAAAAAAAAVAPSGRVLRAVRKPPTPPAPAPAKEGTKRSSRGGARESDTAEKEEAAAAAAPTASKRRRSSDAAKAPESNPAEPMDDENAHPNEEEEEAAEAAAKRPATEAGRRRSKKPDGPPLQAAAKATPLPAKPTAKVTSRQRGKQAPQPESPQPSPVTSATKKAKMRAPGAEPAAAPEMDVEEPQAAVTRERPSLKPTAPTRRALTMTAQKKQRPAAPAHLDDADAASQAAEPPSSKLVEESAVARSFASWRPKASSPASEASDQPDAFERMDVSSAARAQTRHASSSTGAAFQVSSSRGALSLHMTSHDDEDDDADAASVDARKDRRVVRPQVKGKKGARPAAGDGSSPDSALSTEGDGEEEIISGSEEDGVIAM